MLEHCHDARERWGGVHQLLDRWLQSRQDLIEAYLQLKIDTRPGEELEVFCDRLMDYLSAGHFEVYEQLMVEAEAFGDARAVELAQQIYPRIESGTSKAVDFNDRYGEGQADLSALSRDLGQLGQSLHERFELEDCLIEVLHNAHRQADTA